jgi:hypothetical protein
LARRGGGHDHERRYAGVDQRSAFDDLSSYGAIFSTGIIDALPLRRTTLLALLSLSLLALASRVIFGVGVPGLVATVDPSPNTAFGTTTYVGMTDVFNGGFRVWEFNDPSCPGLLRIVELPLSGEAASLSQVLRQPGEDIAYWYGGTIYGDMERSIWLIRYAIQKLWFLVHVKNRMPPKPIYLKIFHPTACVVPPTADWPMLAAAIHQ